MANPRSLTIVRITTVVVICLQSLLTALEAVRSPTVSTLGSALPWIAAVEGVVAVLILFRRTAFVGGVLLLTIFAFDLVVFGPAEQLSLFVYAAVILMLISDARRSKES